MLPFTGPVRFPLEAPARPAAQRRAPGARAPRGIAGSARARRASRAGVECALRTLGLALLAGFALAVAEPARAGCCDILKVDETVPATTIRVCEPDGSGECGALLFGGTLSVGESQQVCTEADVVVYQEWDDALSAFRAPVTAVCEGLPVEF